MQLQNSNSPEYKDPVENSNLLQEIIEKTIKPKEPKIIPQFKQEYQQQPFPIPPPDPTLLAKIKQLEAQLKFAEDYIHANEPKSYQKPIFERPSIRWEYDSNPIPTKSIIKTEYCTKYDLLKAK